ncbi:MAG: NUDIX hydrolase [Kiritimatiellia bacterium]
MEKTIDSHIAFAGRALTLEVLSIDMGEGRKSVREIIRHPGAVVVLAQRPDDSFIFVRQYRKAIECLLLETVAGTLEPDEDPAACAARELQEESGYIAECLTALGTIVPAPGYSSEKLFLFHARTGMRPGAICPDEDERIAVVHMTRQEVDAAIDRGELYDAKTLAAWLLFTRHPA